MELSTRFSWGQLFLQVMSKMPRQQEFKILSKDFPLV
jgi:hypothetical protein